MNFQHNILIATATALQKEIKMQLSDQALGAIMMALQESLLNQIDIVPILKGFDIIEGETGLEVRNPPTVRFTDNSEVTADDLKSMVE